jgi:hypothetical protein
MMPDSFPQHSAFRHKLGKDGSAEFDRVLKRAAILFVAGDGRYLSFNVELGDGVDVAVTLERR